MPTKFDDLPYEIRSEIFQLAANVAHRPRVVEIFFKNGEIYSKTLPPPLLQVCQLSRHVTLRIYKPWLPQFAGMVAHQPWEDAVRRKGVERLSRLQNVCIDLKYDVLFINDQQWAAWKFGFLERKLLGNMAVNLEGWITWTDLAPLAGQFNKLRKLTLLDRRNNEDDNTLLKIDWTEQKLYQMEKKQKGKSGYVAPIVGHEIVAEATKWMEHISDWILYKYPKGYKALSASSRSVNCVDGRGDSNSKRRDEASETESKSNLGPTPTMKRPRLHFEGSIATSRKSARISYTTSEQRKPSPLPVASTICPAVCETRELLITPPTPTIVEKQQALPLPTSPQLPTQASFTKVFEYLELAARSPSPEQQPQLPATPLRNISTEGASLDLDVDWEPFLQPSSPPDQCVVPPFIEDFSEPTPSPTGLAFVDPRTFFRFDTVEDDSWDLNGTAYMNSRGMEDSMGDEEDEDTERLLQEQLQAELRNTVEGDNSRNRRKRRSRQSSAPETHSDAPIALEPETEESEIEGIESSHVPAKIMAERRVLAEIQLLVKWKNYPDEKDWTWEFQFVLKKTAPTLVKAWRKKKDKEDAEAEVILEDIVEKILGKRKWKGVPHYLVKWKGYEEVKDRTWEPCERLKVDVPEMVNAYESKGKKKPKK